MLFFFNELSSIQWIIGDSNRSAWVESNVKTKYICEIDLLHLISKYKRRVLHVFIAYTLQNSSRKKCSRTQSNWGKLKSKVIIISVKLRTYFAVRKSPHELPCSKTFYFHLLYLAGMPQQELHTHIKWWIFMNHFIFAIIHCRHIRTKIPHANRMLSIFPVVIVQGPRNRFVRNMYTTNAKKQTSKYISALSSYALKWNSWTYSWLRILSMIWGY